MAPALHISSTGSGPRVFVCLHGWSGDHRAFAPLVERLPADATLLALDLPGCGRSPAPRHWRIDDVGHMVAEAIRPAVAAAGVSSATLVGNCSGGLVGLAAALHAGALFERIALIDPFAYFPWYFRLFTLGELGRRAYHATFASELGRRLTDRSLRSKRTTDTSLTASFAEVDHATTLRYLELLTQIESPWSFGAIAADVDIVVGERTFGAIHRSVDIWRRVWPLARVHTLAGAGHLPLEESPDALAGILFGGESVTTSAKTLEAYTR